MAGRCPPERPAHRTCPAMSHATRSASRLLSALAVVSMAWLCVATGAVQADERPTPAISAEMTELFEKHVRPLLVNRCLECHGAKQEGGLRLDSREGMVSG